MPFELIGLLSAVVSVWLLTVGALLVVAYRRRRFFRGLIGIILGHVLLAGVGWWLVTDRQPVVTTDGMTIDDKITLRREIESSPGGDQYHLEISGPRLSRSLRTAADLVGSEVHSEIEFDVANRFHGTAAVRIPGGRYLNLGGTGTLTIDGSSRSLELADFWIGRLVFPGFARDLLTESILELPHADHRLARAAATIRSARVRDGKLAVDISRDKRWLSDVADQARPDQLNAVGRAAAEVVDRWSRTEIDAGTDPFQASMRAMFRLAGKVAPERSPRFQNRAALLAGGIAIGHPDLARLAGQRLDADVRNRLRAQPTVRLRDRHDLARHFWISAALVAVSESRISSMLGLSKEETDSAEGGSGFSFPDLAADKAGVRFAEVALADPPAAEALQASVAGDWAIDDLVPVVKDLPEGISQGELEAVYGGTEGDRFNEVVDIIDRRLDRCRLLRPRPAQGR
jgi:hypothetical protein